MPSPFKSKPTYIKFGWPSLVVSMPATASGKGEANDACSVVEAIAAVVEVCAAANSDVNVVCSAEAALLGDCKADGAGKTGDVPDWTCGGVMLPCRIAMS
jgi:hypothetical protein